MASQREKIIARDRNHLKQLIYETIQKEGPNCDLNFIDVSEVDNMDGLFAGVNSSFNGDISGWNVSHVQSMSDMFRDAKFNGDISQWNVSGIWDMGELFAYSHFAGDVSGWDVSDDSCIGMFAGSLLEMKELVPEWYKIIEEKQRLEKERLDLEENSVKEDDFNSDDDEDVEDLPF